MRRLGLRLTAMDMDTTRDLLWVRGVQNDTCEPRNEKEASKRRSIDLSPQTQTISNLVNPLLLLTLTRYTYTQVINLKATKAITVKQIIKIPNIRIKNTNNNREMNNKIT